MSIAADPSKYEICKQCFVNLSAEYKSKEIEKLQKENAELKKCVEFYADTKNWGSVPVNSSPDCMGFYCYANEYFGGALARATLKKLEEKNEKET